MEKLKNIVAFVQKVQPYAKFAVALIGAAALAAQLALEAGGNYVSVAIAVGTAVAVFVKSNKV